MPLSDAMEYEAEIQRRQEAARKLAEERARQEAAARESAARQAQAKQQATQTETGNVNLLINEFAKQFPAVHKQIAEAQKPGQAITPTGVTVFSPLTTWKPYQYNAEGKPDSYIDKDKVVHYAPNHPMYKMGWRTSAGLGEGKSRVYGELTKNEKSELAKARKAYDSLTAKDRLTESEKKQLKEATDKLVELNQKIQQRGLAGHWLSQGTPGEYAGLTVGSRTLTMKQANELKDLAVKQDWEGVFQYQKELGIIDPSRMSPNEEKRLTATMRAYMYPDGSGYNYALIVQHIAEGKTILNYSDLAKFFGRQTGERIIKSVKDFNEAKTVTAAFESKKGTGEKDDESMFRYYQSKGEIPKAAVFIKQDKDGTIHYKTIATETIYQNAKGEQIDKSVIDNAKSALGKYQNKDGSYDLIGALVAGNNAKTAQEQKDIINAIETLFPPDDVAKYKQVHYVLFDVWDRGKGKSFTKNELDAIIKNTDLILKTNNPASSKITSSYIKQSQGEAAGIPAPMMAALGVTALTPIPGDEIAVGIIALATLGVTQGVKFIRQWKNQTGKNPSLGDIALLETNKNGVIKATAIDPEKFREVGGIQQLIPPNVQTAQRTEFRPSEFPANTGTELKPPAVLKLSTPGFYGKQNEMVFLPTPADTKEAGDNYLTAGVALKVAEKTQAELKDKLTKDYGIELPAEYQETDKLLPKTEYEKLISQLPYGGPQTKLNLKRRWEQYITAYDEYLAKKRIYNDAKRQYISFMNPEIFKHTEAEKEALAALGLIKTYTKSRSKTVSDLDTETESLTKELERVYEKTYENALARNLTATQATTKAQMAVKQMLNQLTKVALSTATRTLTQSQAKTQTGTQTKPVVEQSTTSQTEQTNTNTRTRVNEKTRIDERIRETPTPPAKRRSPDPRDQEKRELLSEKQGLVARRRGELRGKSIWRVNYYPYGQNDKLVLFGDPPAGAIPATGPGSVADSATLIYGIPPSKPLKDNTGAVDDIIYPIITKEGGKNKILVRSVKDTSVSKPKPVVMSRGSYRKRAKAGVLPGRDLGGGIEQTAKGRHIKL